MSDWNEDREHDNTSAPNVADAKKAVIPLPVMIPRDKEHILLAGFEKTKAGENIAWRKAVPKGYRLTSYTPIRHADGSIVAVDMRCDRVGDPPDKKHRIAFFAEHFRTISEASWELSALIKHDLLLPANMPEVVGALQAHEEGKGLPVAVAWCEGEKTRKALAERMSHPYAITKAAGQGIRVVTSAWFCCRATNKMRVQRQSG